MQDAAQRLVGHHDFTSFRSSICQAASPVKTLDRLEVEREGEEIRIQPRARSFLHHQVRNMVGTLKLVGEGRWRADDVAAALAARSPRRRADGAARGSVSGRGPLLAPDASLAPMLTWDVLGCGMSDLFPGFDSQRLPIDDFEIHFRRAGKGPPLLLLHGYPETHVCWHRVAPRLAESFSLVLPDLPGYGDSSFLEPDEANRRYSKRNMAAVMAGLMQALGHERFALVGHDRGARVAYRLALDRPHLVERLALLDIIPDHRGLGKLRQEARRLPPSIGRSWPNPADCRSG